MDFLIVIFGFIIDRLTKIWAIDTLNSGDITIIKNYMDLSYLENRGAAFGILQNQRIFLAIITLLFIIGVVIFMLKFKPKSLFFKISIMLIISGACGNLYDRLIYGYVVDFILIHYKNIYYYPTFNVADILVVVGTILLLFYIVKDDKNE